MTTYEDLTEVPDDSVLPWLDRANVDVVDGMLDPIQREWRDRGCVVLPGLIPADLIDAYVRRFEQYHNVFGFQSPTPYEHVPEIRDIALHPQLVATVNGLIGAEMILHLNLTPWVSTERKWHQDDYLNPPVVNSWYLAAWVALDDVTPESGPFEYIPGSHRWPVLRRDRVMALMTSDQVVKDASDPQSLWTLFTEDEVSRVVEAYRVRMGAAVEQFLGKRGDVLIWHARLQHRGGAASVRVRDRWRPWKAKMPPRPALISHYTAVDHLGIDPGMLVAGAGGRHVGHRLGLDHLYGERGPSAVTRAKTRIEWALRRRS